MNIVSYISLEVVGPSNLLICILASFNAWSRSSPLYYLRSSCINCIVALSQVPWNLRDCIPRTRVSRSLLHFAGLPGGGVLLASRLRSPDLAWPQSNSASIIVQFHPWKGKPTELMGNNLRAPQPSTFPCCHANFGDVRARFGSHPWLRRELPKAKMLQITFLQK